MQLGQFAAPARQRRLAAAARCGLVLEIAERQVAHHRLRGRGDRLRVAPVRAQEERAAAHVQPDRAQAEPAGIDGLLAVADEHQVAVVGGAIERHQQPHVRRGQVLRLVDDDRVEARALAALRELDRAQRSSGQSVRPARCSVSR